MEYGTEEQLPALSLSLCEQLDEGGHAVGRFFSDYLAEICRSCVPYEFR